MNGLFVLFPIMGMGIAVAAIISSAVLKMQRMRLEEERLNAGRSGDQDELTRQVAELRHELTDVQERLDFTERILTQGRETSGLPPAPPNQNG